MKNTALLIGIVCFGILAGYSAIGQDTNKIKTLSGSIEFVNVSADKVLNVYKGIVNAELIVASDVPLQRAIITVHAKSVSGEVLRQMLEEALLKQTGIVITRIDDKRISVTYNDRLKLDH